MPAALSLPDPGQPTAVLVSAGPSTLTEAARSAGGWSGEGIEVSLDRRADEGVEVAVEAAGEVARVVLRWAADVPARSLVLGDAWERSYGDLQWRHRQPERLLPWYWLAHDPMTGATTGMGVDVQPAAFCGWTVDADGISLWLDLRNGGSPTRLDGRRLRAATVRRFVSGPTPWQTLGAAVTAMATDLPPLRDVGPVVGANNWYYAYGEGFDEAAVLGDARTVVELADGHPVRPFSVIDDGWNTGGATAGGPWDEGTPGVFDDMAATAARISEVGARPGLWFRPLLTRDPGLAEVSRTDRRGRQVLDPSTDRVREQVVEDLRRFAGWGYELVKHDFSTYDVLGGFGPAMQDRLTSPGWHLADRSRTTAEVLRDLYRDIRTAAPGMVVIGCNTVNHLAAGLVDVQRTGDDTSGRQWERTRRMGVNTLAFRTPQHGRFFTVDADCVASTPQTPWALNRRFLDLVAASGTALFVSVDPGTRSDEVDRDLSRALRLALDGGEPGGVEPLDWLNDTTPVRWRVGDRERTFSWSEPWGADPGVV
ncbi:alpha-amylase family protein [Auraticoccus monumenti]|uniref:Alpha-galactosidase n=1 Tax=Auraticoccus monumenti TaxID=675864 RepID=A0A1G7C5J2_9ACTN|nr:hypothetical protein [Auraticoccus monumenti]SDE33705.1 alpha-galactosidase [Auraticoccus monumenti]